MKAVLLTAAVAALGTLSACVSTAPNWEASFGDSTHTTMTAQVLDKDAAAKNGTALAATDGKAAGGAQTRYAQSYGYAVKDAAPTVIVQPTAAK